MAQYSTTISYKLIISKDNIETEQQGKKQMEGNISLYFPPNKTIKAWELSLR